MTSEQSKKWAKNIMRLLKVDEVIFPICRTSKGNFGLRYGVNTEDYEMYLDAVPLPTKDILNDENNIELKKMLEKYVFGQLSMKEQGWTASSASVSSYIVADQSGTRIEEVAPEVIKPFEAPPLPTKLVAEIKKIKKVEEQKVGVAPEQPTEEPKKKRGRPAGSKNKK